MARRLRETGDCYNSDGQRVLITLLYQGEVGAWEVEVKEVGGSGHFKRTFNTEARARLALDEAHDHGRQFGAWKIRRAYDYTPLSSPTAA